MKKMYLLRLMKLLALVLPILVFISVLQNWFFFYTDDNTERIRNFYNEEKNSLDVVFLGASELHNGFSPGYAYDKYGFTSYLYTIGSNPCTLYKSELKEILAYQNPELIVVDLSGFLYVEEEKLTSEARLRIYSESIPGSLNKLDTIMSFPYDDKLSCFIPLIKYHGDWIDTDQVVSRFRSKLSQRDVPSFLKGVVTNTKAYDTEPEMRILHKPIDSNVEVMSEEYLKDFLTYCKEEHLDNIVFLNLPRNLEKDRDNVFRNRTLRMIETILVNGFSVLDLQDQTMKIGCTFSEDYYDFEHPNIYGQRKLTDYIGQLIVNQFQVTPMKQSEKNKQHWEQSVRYTYAFEEYAERLHSKGEAVYLAEDEKLIVLLDQQNCDETL